MAGTAAAIPPARPRVRRRFVLALMVLMTVAAAIPVVGPLIEEQANAASTTLPPTSNTTVVIEIVSDDAVPVSTTDLVALAPLEDATTTDTTTTDAPEQVPLDIVEPLDIDAAFDPVHDRLATVVEVPIRLPLDLGDGADSWQPTLSSIDSGGYIVHLGSGADCNGASQCRVSTFTARRSLRSNPTVTNTGTPVPLPNDLSGVFSDSSCGADCSNGFITWVEGNVLYSVGSRLASGPEVLALAWNAIDSSQAAPEPPEICGPGAPSDSGRVARTLSTELADGRSMYWLVACSIDGTIVEVLRDEGELRWFDIDDDGFRDAIVTLQDGSSTIFAMGANTPRAAIDIATSGRLTVGDLGCADIDEDGQFEAIDVSSGDRLIFLNPITVRRSPLDDVDLSSVGPC